MIGLKLTIVDQEALVNFEGLNERTRSTLEAKMREMMNLLKEKVRDNLSGKVLNSKTGALSASLVDGVERLGSSLIGFVVVEPNDPKVEAYARVHEYGGKDYYEIVPVNKMILRFVGKAGDVVFAPYVYHPPSPKRSYLRSALWELRPKIEKELSDAMTEAMRR